MTQIHIEDYKLAHQCANYDYSCDQQVERMVRKAIIRSTTGFVLDLREALQMESLLQKVYNKSPKKM